MTLCSTLSLCERVEFLSERGELRNSGEGIKSKYQPLASFQPAD